MFSAGFKRLLVSEIKILTEEYFKHVKLINQSISDISVMLHTVFESNCPCFIL